MEWIKSIIIITIGPRFTAPLGEYSNDYVKKSVRYFEYFSGLLGFDRFRNQVALQRELRCIDGSLYRGPAVVL